MNDLRACPACEGTSLHPFSITPVPERANVMHFAQTRCRSCDLVFSNPVAEAAELARFYTSAYYEEHEPLFDRDQPDLPEIIAGWERDEALGLRHSVLPYVPSGTFFEIGVGHGRLLAGARSLGFTVAGVEPSERASRFAREVMGFDQVRQAMFEPSDWPAGFCDVVYAFQVIEHVLDLRAFVEGIRHVLKPDGLVVIGTENHHNAWLMVRRVRSWLKGRRLPEFQTGSHHTFYFSDKSLRHVFERHGFDVFNVKVYTPSLAEKLPHYHFRSWRSKLAFFTLHYADVWTGRGGRVLMWARKPI